MPPKGRTRHVEIHFPARHRVQQVAADRPERFKVLDWGRRAGKDILLMDMLCETAIGGLPTAWFAPSYPQMVTVWGQLKKILQPVTQKPSEQLHRLELYGSGTVDLWSLDSADTARGRPYGLVVVNEAAQSPVLQYAWEQVIRPMLTDYKGGAIFGSTPRGFNHFKTLFEKGQDPLETEWWSDQQPTSSNPFIDPAEIEAARKELPAEVFAQEYEAQFISDQTGVFRGLANAAVLEPRERVDGHQYVVGCDWGKMKDFSVFSVIDITTKEQVWMDRSNRLDYMYQVQRLKALREGYRADVVVAEANAMGHAIIEQVRAAGVPVVSWTATQVTKQRMIESLAHAVEMGPLKILKDRVQLAELQAYEQERSSTDKMRYGAPSGMHDDTVIALGLAWLGARPVEKARLRDFVVEAA